MNAKKLPIRNIIKKPVRSGALVLLVMILAASLFGGTIVIQSLNRGLDSLSARMGADIIVLPGDTKTKVDLENLLLQGTPGYFYMSSEYMQKVQEVPGVKHAASQLYLATAKAECCSSRVQIIGFDPTTDFTIQPWIEQSYQESLGLGDVLIGSDISMKSNGTVKLYGESCTVMGQLEKTGTGLDTAIYCNNDTIRQLIAASVARGMNSLVEGDPENVISSIYIQVEDGYDIQSVVDDINIHLRRVDAVRTKNMLTEIGSSLSGLSGTVKLLMGAIWVLALVIMILSFTMLIHERKREFAVYRVMGMSRSMLAKLILKESWCLSLLGGVLGVLLTAIFLFPFRQAIEAAAGLPFLLPKMSAILMFAGVTLVATMLIGPLVSAFTAFRLSRVDVGTILREG